MIGWWMPVKGARVRSPRFLGELSDRGLVTCILVFVCNTSWVGPGQPRERTGPLWGPVGGAVDAGACGGGKLCLAVGHLKFGLGCGTVPCVCEQDLLWVNVVMIHKRIKVFPVHSMKAYKGSGDMAPLILNLGTKWRWIVNFTLLPLYPRKEPQYVLNTRPSGPQNRLEVLEKRNISCPTPDSNPGPPSP
jgi:hypothetical protein